MTHRGTKVIETERLMLRKFEISDTEEMYKNWASDDEVTKYLTWSTYTNSEDVEKMISTWIPKYESDEYYSWIIQLKNSEVIGSIGVVGFDGGYNNAKVGYCLGRQFWGKGYCAEALKSDITH